VVVSSTAMPVHAPVWHVSPLVQAFASSFGVQSRYGVSAHAPPSQVSFPVQELLSSHAAPSSSAALPTQVPFWQVSAAVQELPSRSGERRGGEEWGAQYTLVPAKNTPASQMSAPPA